MSLARKAVRGAALTIASSMGARAVGVVGTLIVTRYLAPEEVGEVGVATIIAMTATWLSYLGFGQYAIVKGQGADGHEATFHATFFHLLFGAFAFAVCIAMSEWFAARFDAPAVAIYLPGMVVAMAIRRLAFMPDKVLVRNLRFRAVAASVALGELAYTATAVGLVVRGWGGEAIVVGNIVQSCVILAIVVAAAGFSEWLRPCKLTWQRTRDLFRFGLPMGIASLAHNAARYWEKLVFAKVFDTGTLGLYNLGYNLADIPAAQVGENLSSVILPSMAKMEPAKRPAALVRSTALLGLIIFPMAVGLGVVSESLIAVVLNEEWQGVAPFLTILSVISVFRPLNWAVSSYLQTQDRTAILAVLEVVQVGVLLGAILLLALLGPLWACAGVGVAFAFQAVALAASVVRTDGVPAGQFLGGFLRPFVASAVMGAAVLGVRYGLRAAGIDSPVISLVAELAVGVVAYVPAAFVFAPATARDFIGLIKSSFLKRG